MKTVTGTVVSSYPISLSKAASTISSFLSSDNGASKALCAYLRRASASFNELKQLHKDLNSSRHHRSEFSNDFPAAGHSSHRIGDGEKIKSPVSVNKIGEKRRENRDVAPNGAVVDKLKIEVESSVVAIEKKKKKKSKDVEDAEDRRSYGKFQISANNGEIDGMDIGDLSTTKKKKKKGRDEYGYELQIDIGGSIEKDRIRDSDGAELKRKERKKRKNQSLEEQEGCDNGGSDEQQSRKRKKANL